MVLRYTNISIQSTSFCISMYIKISNLRKILQNKVGLNSELKFYRYDHNVNRKWFCSGSELHIPLIVLIVLLFVYYGKVWGIRIIKKEKLKTLTKTLNKYTFLKILKKRWSSCSALIYVLNFIILFNIRIIIHSLCV